MDNQQEPNWQDVSNKEGIEAGMMFGIMRYAEIHTEVIPRMLAVLAWQHDQIKQLTADIEELKKRLDAK